jgi:hypothetical protein
MTMMIVEEEDTRYRKDRCDEGLNNEEPRITGFKFKLRFQRSQVTSFRRASACSALELEFGRTAHVRDQNNKGFQWPMKNIGP